MPQPQAPADRRKRSLPLWKRMVFACLPVVGLLLFGEVVARAAREPFHLGSYRELRLDLARRGYPAVHDPLLGYSPQPGFSSSDNHWGTQVTIDEHGLRSNGKAAPNTDARGVVAVGDSFTFGDQVSDAATWPAYLESELAVPVRNGGVFGYSAVQAALRGEQLVECFAPEWLVLSFIADDLRRNEFARRYTSVPWFDIVGGALVLKNCPVQDEVSRDEANARRFKDVLGHSALVDAVLANVNKEWWYTDQKEVRNTLGWGQGKDVTILLVDRLAAFCRERDCRLLVVLQGKRSLPEADEVIAHARATGVAALDLVAEYQAIVAERPAVEAEWFDGHMTAAGNRWVAGRIAARIEQ